MPAGDAWLHELKLDGYRLQVTKEGRQVRLYSRRGHEWTARLPGLVEELVGIHCRSAIIDAELCLSGAGGVPDFYGLHLRMRYRRSELLVYGFDLLHRDGRDLRALPLTERDDASSGWWSGRTCHASSWLRPSPTAGSCSRSQNSTALRVS